ncbi:MAG: 50S ribosomal protein L13 [Candidatus Marinimicrobia bacterium]|nr:50S ribosomal protein L13 [Candidatus Neomarinimicrobiota bacterium]|tara:strand:- start:9468 stop:9896 length:429 start_codon:yes stop_codon:yes gene_type:complete
MKTTYIKASEIDKKWFIVDATDKTLGRLSSKVAQILKGKNKPFYSPHMDMGDFVIIINADKVKLTGKKETTKDYFKHTNYPGGAKNISIKILKEKKPEFILMNSIKGMLPHNRLGKKILTHLKVYAGDVHPHTSQKPVQLEL